MADLVNWAKVTADQNKANAKAKVKEASASQIKRAQQDVDYQNYLTQTSVNPNGDSVIRGPLSNIERASGVYRPGFETLRDRTTGQLRDIYKQDPFAGEAGQKLKAEALSTGPSTWANMATQKQGLEEQTGRDAAMRQAMQTSGMAQSQLARTGGISSGARARAAQQGAKDALMAQQGVSRQGITQRADIGMQDAARRQQLLGQVTDAEKQAQAANVGATMGDVTQKSAFDLSSYKDQMAAYGAKKSAEAQAAAAGGGKK